MTWDISGFDSYYLRPIFAAKIINAAGPAAGTGQMDVLCIGLKTGSGDLVVDSEIRRVYTREECNTAAGEGSQLALMGIAALKANPNVNLYLAAVTESGGTQADVTLALATVPTSDGTITIYINGVAISTSYTAGTAVATIGAALAAAVNASPDCPFTASGTTTVTLTCRNKGLGGRDWIIYQDMSLAGGITSTLTGSAVVNTFGQVKGVLAGAVGGAGAEDYTTILTKITTKRYARIALGSRDTTNAALVKTSITALAAVTVQIYDHAFFGFNGSQANATTLAQTTLNTPRARVLAHRNSETHPAIIAAGWAATAAAVEGDDPVPDYDNFDCSAWITPQRFATDTWLPTEENALLNAGVTPLKTENGATKCVRGIVTYCLNGAVQDLRCLDVGDAVFPDYAVLDIYGSVWVPFREANKYVGPDPDFEAGELEPPAGVAYPKLWVSALKARYNVWFANGWVEDTFSGDSPKYPVQAAYNSVARRIQSNAPFVVRRVQHQVGLIARQTAP